MSRRRLAAATVLAAALVVVLVLGPWSSLGRAFLERVRATFGSGTRTRAALACEGCNLIIVSITNTRKDHLGLYGYDRPTTPNIDAFFARSLVFHEAFAPASWTLPVAASLFSSLFPYRHGVMERQTHMQALSPHVLTLAEILRQGGYRTAAFTGSGDYQRVFGLDQGFEVYLDRFNYADFDIGTSRFGRSQAWEYGPVENLLPVALRWLDKHAREKFFLFLQGYDTHCPFVPSEPFRSKFTDGLRTEVDLSECLWTFDSVQAVVRDGKRYWPLKTKLATLADGTKVRSIEDVLVSEDDLRYLIALYDGELAQVDAALATLFGRVRQLGLESKTVLVLLSEHGDLFGEHGRFMRAGPVRGTFYEGVMNFPLVVRHPRVPERIDVHDLVQTVDLMPTLLGMLSIPDPLRDVRDGSFLPLSAFGDRAARSHVFAASSFSPRRSQSEFNQATDSQAVRTARWKLIREQFARAVHYELYDLARDPQEEHNLYETARERADALEAQLDRWLEELARRPRFRPVSPPERVFMGSSP